MRLRLSLLLSLLLSLTLPVSAQTEDDPNAPMTLERLNQIILLLDPKAQSDGSIWQLQIADVPLLIVTGIEANRMRAVAPVREADGLTSDELTRMMQANFDSALDARYAIAQGMAWATFIHPLAALEKNELISGLGQVVNITQSYGTLYSGGALQYGGGDSEGLQRQLIDELLKKGEEI